MKLLALILVLLVGAVPGLFELLLLESGRRGSKVSGLPHCSLSIHHHSRLIWSRAFLSRHDAISGSPSFQARTPSGGRNRHARPVQPRHQGRSRLPAHASVSDSCRTRGFRLVNAHTRRPADLWRGLGPMDPIPHPVAATRRPAGRRSGPQAFGLWPLRGRSCVLDARSTSAQSRRRLGAGG